MTLDDIRCGVLICLAIIIVSVAVIKNRDERW